MKILFYLPSVTPWWLDNVINPVILELKKYFSVSVIVPYFHNGTGVIKDHCATMDQNPDVDWHIIDQQSYPSLRTPVGHSEEIIRLVNSIGADFTLCRTVDTSTPQFFVGRVSYIMEVGYPPLRYPFACSISNEPLFAIGCMPRLDGSTIAELRSLLEQPWLQMRENFSRLNTLVPRASYLERYGLPADKVIIAVPLEYEHVENDFLQYRPYRNNISLINFLLGQFDERFFFAITNHPLNILYSDQTAIQKLVEAQPHRAKLIDSPKIDLGATDILFNYCDGVIVENSKSIYSALFSSKPILRLSNGYNSPVTNIYTDINLFTESVAGNRANVIKEDDARLIFSYQVANSMIAMATLSWTRDEALARLQGSFHPETWEKNVAIFKKMRTQDINMDAIQKELTVQN